MTATTPDPLAKAATVERSLDAPPEQVWAVLADGWLYPSWVVGASRMRDVDDSWPAPGALLHHSVGGWPLLIDDTSEVLEAAPPQRLRLRVRAWPTGAAEVEMEIAAQGAGSVVRMREDAVAGPGTLAPRPLRQAALVPRNREALRRLAYLAERRG